MLFIYTRAMDFQVKSLVFLMKFYELLYLRRLWLEFLMLCSSYTLCANDLGVIAMQFLNINMAP